MIAVQKHAGWSLGSVPRNVAMQLAGRRRAIFPQGGQRNRPATPDDDVSRPQDVGGQPPAVPTGRDDIARGFRPLSSTAAVNTLGEEMVHEKDRDGCGKTQAPAISAPPALSADRAQVQEAVARGRKSVGDVRHSF